ncbi:hypothetical protein CI109_103081 [Kwoniella shandongensis]|uniref:Uncharacterized protein n=1 Tax=Kwoniella shandongensis TaxID=1734106 RepID=A0AAJ8LG76_9TREE
MSLQDRLASQDAMQLLTTASSLALVTAAYGTGFSYNFPLLLFGIVAHELRSSTTPLRQFLVLVLFTGLFDIFGLLFRHYGSVIILVSVLLLVFLKVAIFFSCLVQLRERGGDLRFGGGEGGFTFPGNGNAADWNLPMPGGFGGGGAGQTTGHGQPPSSNVAQTASFPSSGGFRLGGDEDEGEGNPTPLPPPGRGGYQTID